MRVIGTEKLGKGRYRVRLEGTEELILYRGELRRYGIEEGEELSEADYREIREVLLFKRAQNRLLFLLQRKDYTRAELMRKLREGAYPEDAAERALAVMEEYGYVDDTSYAMRYAECYRERKSSTTIRNELLRKGIAKELADAALEEFAPDEETERAQIRSLLEKRHYDPEAADINGRRKQYAYLMGKGYRSSDILACLGT